MRITTKGRYALRAMARLAMTPGNSPTPIREIASLEDISPEFLEQLFFSLRKAGIVSSVRGPGGGFRLAHEAENINVEQIFEAVGEGLEITPCVECRRQGLRECSHKEACLVHDIWMEAYEHISSYFRGLTLQQIVDRAKDKGLTELIETGEVEL